jgi:putative peptide zinc metalloprotease protein
MSLWTRLKNKLDFAQCTFKRLDNIIVSELESKREGKYYIIKNPEKVKYLKLSEKDYFIWSKLDGTLTVKDIVVAYFMKYKVLAFERVGTLITQLKENYFLETPPVKIFEQIKSKLLKKSFEYYLLNFQTIFFQKEFSIAGIDGYLDFLYKKFFFLFFTRIAKIIYILLSISGISLFLYLFYKGTYPLLTTSGSYGMGFFTIVIISIILVFAHEGAHAFTTKSYGRIVPRGGFLIYYGSPAFFAETSDIWLEPKKHRIAVSWAGPFANIIVGSICSYIVFLCPDFILNSILYKVAFFTYLGALINLNPLLEFDGYFILMDWLEIPLLRKRSLAFLKSDLWKKLRKREKFSEEERIFTIFGLMALLWTVVTIGLSLFFIKSRFTSIINDIMYGKDMISRIIAVLSLAIFIVPILLSLIALIYITVKKITLSIMKLKLWNKIENIAFVLFILSVIIFLLSCMLTAISHISVYKIILPFILSAAFYFGILSYKQQRGSGLKGMLVFSLFILMLFSSSLTKVFNYEIMSVYFNKASFIFLAIFICQICIGFNIKLFTIFEKLLFILYIPLIISVIWYVHQGHWNFFSYVYVIVGITAQFIFIPFLFNYFKTKFFISFVMNNTGILLLTLSIVYFILPFRGASSIFITDGLKLAASLLILDGLILYNFIHKKFFFTWKPLQGKETLSEKEFLSLISYNFIENILNDFTEKYGYRSEKQLELDFNSTFQVENMSLKKRKLEIKQDISLIEMDEIIVKGLNFIIKYMMNTAGEAYTKKLMIYGRDQLSWKEREISDYHIFEKVIILKDYISFKPSFPVDKTSIIKNIPFFADSKDIDKLIDLFKMEFYLSGQDIIRQGEEGHKFYIITEGNANVFLKDISGVEREIATLTKGDFFGEVALFEDSLRTATVRANTPVELLVMDREDFRKTVKEHFREYQELHEDSTEIVRFIEKISLFNEFPRSQVNFIAWKMRKMKCKEGEEIIKQGETGRRYFYVIKSGEFLAESESGEKKELSRMGSGEYFGEIALLLDIPRTATVRALTDGELYSLEEKDFDNILGTSLYSQKTLELVSSRRLYNK